MVAKPNEMNPSPASTPRSSIPPREPASQLPTDRLEDCSPEHWQSEIDRTRARLDSTVDELEHRLTFDEITTRSMHALQQSTMKGASKVADLVKQNPLPAMVIGAGVAWLFLQNKSKSSTQRAASYGGAIDAHASDESSGDSSTFSDAASRAASKVSQVASNVGEKVTHATHDAADGMVRAVSHVKDGLRGATAAIGQSASSVGHGAQVAAQRSVRYTNECVHNYPLAAAGVCFALGVLGGLAIPASQLEDDALGATRDRLKNQAQQKGAELLDQGRDVAERVTAQASDKIKSALTSGSVQEAHQTSGSNDPAEISGTPPNSLSS